MTSIGIQVSDGPVGPDTFLPGIEVVDGGLQIDVTKLKYPGDILHEAGHLAVTPACDRSRLQGTVNSIGKPIQVVEVEAMCWSYAACIHLGIDPRVVFHEDGYHGRSESLLRSFELGLFIGLPGLEAAGMTLSAPRAAELGTEAFPVMQKWLRD